MEELRKIESEVFTRHVVLTLGHFMDKGLIKTLDFPISKGKEAYVFRATAGMAVKEKYLAVKIYMIETSPFKHMWSYIHGDPRFKGVKRTKREIVYAWTRKEFRNLKIFERAGVHAPRPVAFRDNILVMEFIGNETAAPLLKEVGPPDPRQNFKQIISDIKKMHDSGIVHSDISEYNLLVKDKKIYFIDCGQGVALAHPRAEEFLRRDVNNVIRYFSKFGIKESIDEVLNFIKGK